MRFVSCIKPSGRTEGVCITRLTEGADASGVINKQVRRGEDMETVMAVTAVVVVGLSALIIYGIERICRRRRLPHAPYAYQLRVTTGQPRIADKHKIGRAA